MAGEGRWPLERVLFVDDPDPRVGNCPASIVLRRACHLRSAVYQHADSAAPRRDGVTI
jgi:hypothetical protein